MQVHELRKKYNIKHKEFLEILDKLGIDAKGANSTLKPDDVKKVESYFNNDSDEDHEKLVIVSKASEKEKKQEDLEEKEKKQPKNKLKKIPKIKAKQVVGSSVVKQHKDTISKKAKIHVHKQTNKEKQKEEYEDSTTLEDKIEKEETQIVETKEEKIDEAIDKVIKNKEKEKTDKDESQETEKKDKKEDYKKERKFDKSIDLKFNKKKHDQKSTTHKQNKKYDKKPFNKFDKKDTKDDKKDKPHKKIILSRHSGEKKKDKYSKDDKDKGFKDKKFKSKGSEAEPTFPTKQKRHPKDKVTKKHEKKQPQEKEFHIKKKKKEKVYNIPEKIDIPETISIADLAKKMNLKSSELIQKFMSLGEMVTINQVIDSDTAHLICSEFNCEVNVISLFDETVIEVEKDKEKDLQPRSPIVTVMGHVDHGKTKLLDAIRSTNKVASEFGGITQHIGAYKVMTESEDEIVFLDTPGHEAFTSMRMRGAKVTDIVILVVAADDGVMPQTIEAINHAKSAEVPIIVAINKMDVPGANPDRVKQQLADHNLLADTWGGDIFMVELSALKHEGIDQLLETVLLVSEDQNLRANPNTYASGTIIESQIDPGRGPVATVIIQNGTLKVGSFFVAGIYKGKVRAMFDDKGKSINSAPPSTPVEVLGIDGVPEAGDPFQEVKEEKYAKQISSKRQEYKRHEAALSVTHVTLDTLYGAIEEGSIKDLNLIIKADVQGSVEALKEYFEKLSDINDEVRVNVVHTATGGINKSDVLLASASGAIIIGFNVRANPKAAELASKENVEIRRYNIIYDAVEEVKAAMEGLLSPVKKEDVIGQLEIRDIFKISKIGTIAGCYVTNGYINRNAKIRVIRNDVVIYTGGIKSLKRFKDDVNEVKEGYECGVSVERFNDLKIGDILEVFEIKEVARKL